MMRLLEINVLKHPILFLCLASTTHLLLCSTFILSSISVVSQSPGHTGLSCCSLYPRITSSFIMCRALLHWEGFTAIPALRPPTFLLLSTFLRPPQVTTGQSPNISSVWRRAGAEAGAVAEIIQRGCRVLTQLQDLDTGQLHYPCLPWDQEQSRSWIREQPSRTERFTACWMTLSTKPGMNKRWQIQQQSATRVLLIPAEHG